MQCQRDQFENIGNLIFLHREEEMYTENSEFPYFVNGLNVIVSFLLSFMASPMSCHKFTCCEDIPKLSINMLLFFFVRLET